MKFDKFAIKVCLNSEQEEDLRGKTIVLVMSHIFEFLLHINFSRRGSFIWCTVPFCLILSLFVQYGLPWPVEIRPGT